jgi:hypothetical protein
MRLAIFGAVVALTMSAVLIGANVERNADTTAIHFAASYQPQAHWRVVGHTFDPWANNVVRGNDRFSGGKGPTWVIELAAPSDSKWSTYNAVVVINAATGAIDAGDALASN